MLEMQLTLKWRRWTDHPKYLRERGLEFYLSYYLPEMTVLFLNQEEKNLVDVYKFLWVYWRI